MAKIELNDVKLSAEDMTQVTGGVKDLDKASPYIATTLSSSRGAATGLPSGKRQHRPLGS